MNIYLFIDYIGVYAPIILFLLTIFLLRNTHTYLIFFIVSFIFNSILNIILKILIKEPRPNDDQKTIEICVTNGIRVSFDKFGMPSGHAQMCSFSIIFITYVLNNPHITTLYLLFTIISLYQRYIYNNHTMLQLFIGTIIGSVIGYISYIITNKYITGDITINKDDNCLI